MNDNNTETSDVQQDELTHLKQLITTHGKPLIIGALLVLAIISIMVYYKNTKQNNIDKASALLSSARSVQDIEGLVAKYSSTPSAPLAIAKLAKIYFDSGNYDLAIAKYSELKTKFPEHQLTDTADLGIIHCKEAKNELSEAMAAFSAFTKTKGPDHYLTPQSILGEARCLVQLGRNVEAKALYEDFIAANPESAWTPIAEEALSAVNKKLGIKEEDEETEKEEASANPAS